MQRPRAHNATLSQSQVAMRTVPCVDGPRAQDLQLMVCHGYNTVHPRRTLPVAGKACASPGRLQLRETLEKYKMASSYG